MRILADLHIAPRTVQFLRGLQHDVVRVNDLFPPTASDEEIVAAAMRENRVILTQDLDFSDLIALSGRTAPSLITLRLATSRVEYVNAILKQALPALEADATAGAIVTIQEGGVRRRLLPVTKGL